MRRTALLLSMVILSLIAGITTTEAQGKFGFGLIVGDPTGFSWKYKLDGQNALDGALGFSPYDRFRFHVDYLWIARPFNDQNLTLTYGAGGAVGFGRTEYVLVSRGNGYFLRTVETGFGVRGPVGINYMIPRSPVELTLELAPILILTPDGGVGLDGGVAVRVYP